MFFVNGEEHLRASSVTGSPAHSSQTAMPTRHSINRSTLWPIWQSEISSQSAIMKKGLNQTHFLPSCRSTGSEFINAPLTAKPTVYV